MKTIGIVGTAKNTGKTTTLSKLMDGLKSKKLAFTGIGYDGEEIDNITNLPKPRLHFNRGVIIATSEKCLHASKVKFNLIKETQFQTALGKILIAEILEEGKIVIAGPNSAEGLKNILDEIKKISGLDLIFVDGALNRLSPMYLVDKIIFTTGAARNQNINFLVDEMKLIEKVFSFPKSEKFLDENFQNKTVIIKNGLPYEYEQNFLIDKNDFDNFLKFIDKGIDRIYLNGFFSIQSLSNYILKIREKIGKEFELIIKSPIHLLFGEEFISLKNFLERCKTQSIKISYQFKPELIAITLNPFYPSYQNFAYSPAFIDKNEMLSKFRSEINTKVFDVLTEGIDGLLKLI